MNNKFEKNSQKEKFKNPELENEKSELIFKKYTNFEKQLSKIEKMFINLKKVHWF